MSWTELAEQCNLDGLRRECICQMAHKLVKPPSHGYMRCLSCHERFIWTRASTKCPACRRRHSLLDSNVQATAEAVRNVAPLQASCPSRQAFRAPFS